VVNVWQPPVHSRLVADVRLLGPPSQWTAAALPVTRVTGVTDSLNTCASWVTLFSH
jgi:hypothetical protein